MFHKPEPSSQGRTGRRRRQLRAGRGQTTNREISNDVEAARRGVLRANVTRNNLLTHQNDQTKTPTKSANNLKKSDQPDEEFPPTDGKHVDDKIDKMLHHGIKQQNGVAAYAGDLYMMNHAYDEEEQLGQNVDEDFETSSDYREAVTLSLLVAEDILPRSLNRNGHERKRRERERRVSMIDRFPIGVGSGNRTSRTTYDSERNEKELSSNENVLSVPFHQKRRHSCSVMTDIEEKSFRNLR